VFDFNSCDSPESKEFSMATLMIDLLSRKGSEGVVERRGQLLREECCNWVRLRLGVCGFKDSGLFIFIELPMASLIQIIRLELLRILTDQVLLNNWMQIEWLISKMMKIWFQNKPSAIYESSRFHFLIYKFKSVKYNLLHGY